MLSEGHAQDKHVLRMMALGTGLRDATMSYGQSRRCPADGQGPCAGERCVTDPSRAPGSARSAAVSVPSRASPLRLLRRRSLCTATSAGCPGTGRRTAPLQHEPCARPSGHAYSSSGRTAPRRARAGSGSARPLPAAARREPAPGPRRRHSVLGAASCEGWRLPPSPRSQVT